MVTMAKLLRIYYYLEKNGRLTSKSVGIIENELSECFYFLFRDFLDF